MKNVFHGYFHFSGQIVVTNFEKKNKLILLLNQLVNLCVKVFRYSSLSVTVLVIVSSLVSRTSFFVVIEHLQFL